MSSKQVKTNLENSFKNISSSGGMQSIFVVHASQDGVREDFDTFIDKRVREEQIIRIDLKEEDYYVPLAPILYIINEILKKRNISLDNIAHILHVEQYDRVFLQRMLSNQPVVSAYYLLPADFSYLKNHMYDYIQKIFIHLVSNSEPYVISVTNLNYAGKTSIDFLIDFLYSNRKETRAYNSLDFTTGMNTSLPNSTDVIRAEDSEKASISKIGNVFSFKHNSGNGNSSLNQPNSAFKEKNKDLKNDPNCLLLFSYNPSIGTERAAEFLETEARLERVGIVIRPNDSDYFEMAPHPWPYHSYQAKVIESTDDVIKYCNVLLNYFCCGEVIRIVQFYLKMVMNDNSKNRDLKGNREETLRLLLGRAYLYLGEYEEALISYDLMYEKAQYHNYTDEACRAYIELAFTHIYRSDFESVLHFAELAYHLGEVSMNLKLVAIANFCLFVAYDRTNLKFGIHKITALCENLERLGFIKELVYVLRTAFAQSGHDHAMTSSMALQMCSRAIDLCNHYGIKHELAAAHHCRGIIYYNLKRIDDALNSYKLSEKIFTENNITTELTHVYNSIGFLLGEQEDYLRANAYYLKGLRNSLNQNDFSEIAITLFNISELYIYCGKYRDALQVLDILQDVMSIRGISKLPFHNLHDIILNKALIYYCIGDNVSAEQMVKRSQYLCHSLLRQNNEEFLLDLIKALLKQDSEDLEAVDKNYALATEKMEKDAESITIRLKVLYYLVGISIYNHRNDFEKKYQCLQLGYKFASKNNLQLSCKLLEKFFADPTVIPFETASKIEAPMNEFQQILPLVLQERKVNTLWKQVHEMRLVSMLHAFGLTAKNYEQLASETIRLLCAHFNINGGMIYFVNSDNNEEPTTLIHEFNSSKIYVDFNYRKASKYINSHICSVYSEYYNVQIGSEVLHKLSIYPLMDQEKVFAQLMLYTFEDKANKVDSNSGETLNFISQQLSTQLIMMIQRNKLIEVSSTDMLTKLYNRMEFNNQMNHVIENLPNYQNIALGFIDLDNFKYYNDNLGHDVGDKLLVWFAQLLNSYKQPKDIACRWGGDEFLLLMRNCDADEAEKRMQLILDKLKSKNGYKAEIEEFLGHPVDNLPERYYLACSIGVMDSSSLPRPFTESELLTHADAALYEVKRTGKGRVLNYEKMTHEADDMIVESNR